MRWLAWLEAQESKHPIASCLLVGLATLLALCIFVYLVYLFLV